MQMIPEADEDPTPIPPSHDSQGAARLDVAAPAAGGISSVNPAGTQEWQEEVSGPVPTSEAKLMSFVAVMVNQGLKQQTIKAYLSAVAGETHGWRTCPS